jgi:hypothetical protein
MVDVLVGLIDIAPLVKTVRCPLQRPRSSSEDIYGVDHER